MLNNLTVTVPIHEIFCLFGFKVYKQQLIFYLTYIRGFLEKFAMKVIYGKIIVYIVG